MKLLGLCAVSILIVVPQFVFAEPPLSKTDFAFGNEVVPSDNKSVIQITLPESLYSVSKNMSLADVSVFNSSGESVPHQMYEPEKKQLEIKKGMKLLPIFPIYGNIMAEEALSHIKISTGADKTLIELIPSAKPRINKGKLEGYIVDASKVEDRIESFRFLFANPPKNKFLSLKIEGSSDLRQWSTVAANGVLAWFDMNQQSIIQDAISIHSAAHKFYRISEEFGEELPQLQNLEANFSSELKNLDSVSYLKTIEGKKAETKSEPLSHVFDLGGNLPVSGVQIKFKDKNSIARFLIQGSNAANGPWIDISEDNFFSIQQSEKVHEVLTAKFEKRSFQFWKLQLLSDVSGIGPQFPEISFVWEPHRLIFLARGEPPFLLAYGSAKALVSSQTILPEFEEKDIAVAKLQNQITLGGPAQLEAVIEVQHDYRKYVLWAILIIGALFIGTMALRVKKSSF